ncbi:PH domain-containing protein [uncultured Duncaniella sp.]|uniref:PH domain-containing protein n=6 Tax=uncultured Duncaniella sp. TaxID=2768039 RepID=UPI0025B09FC8|nr:PH domain-containing protein [uncultured Duncaniella sp.]
MKQIWLIIGVACVLISSIGRMANSLTDVLIAVGAIAVVALVIWLYKWPIIMWCIFDVIIFIAAPTILWGLFAVLWSGAPLLAVVLLARYIWGNVTYAIDDDVLRISTPLKSLVISIDNIKKIRRGKFWVESGRNYSATYIKLRIIYDRNSYIYVSPEDEELFVDTLQAINPNIEYSSERGL